MIFQNITKSKVNNYVNQIQSDLPILNMINISKMCRFYGVFLQFRVYLMHKQILEKICYYVQNESRMTIDILLH